MKPKYDQTLWMTVCIPGSGKSTWSKKFCEKHPNVEYICPDELRKIHGTGVNDQTVNNLVWKIAKRKAIDTLLQKRSCIIDGINIKAKMRRSLLGFISSNVYFPFNKIAVTFDTDLDPDVCWNRIQKDLQNGVDRANIPLDVFENMVEIYKTNFKHLATDGFDSIIEGNKL